jgi:hypothetical protein
MHLDRRQPDGGYGVLEGPARVGQGARVYDQAVHPGSGVVEAIDQRTFVVGLECFDLQSELGSPVSDMILELSQRGGSVDLRLADAKQVQVGAVENEDPLHRREWYAAAVRKLAVGFSRLPV